MRSRADDFGIWLLPASLERCRLTAIIVRIADALGSPSFAPHVTVHANLRVELRRLTGAVSRQAFIMAPFYVRVQSIEQSDEYFRGLYARLCDDLLLRRLRADLGEGLKLRLSRVWEPHLSLAYGRVKQGLAETAWRSLVAEPVIRMDRLAIVAAPGGWGDVTTWTVLREHELEGKALSSQSETGDSQ
jgi:hypothetical protein